MTNDQNGPIQHGPRTGSSLGLDDDDLYRVLASTRRRRLLYVLLDGKERCVDELATVLTGWDTVDTDTIHGAETRRRIEVDLRHSHLPLLAEVGLIDWDRQQSTVSVQSVAPEVRDLLQRSVEPRASDQ